MKNLRIRYASADDIPAILDIYSHYILNTTVTFETHIPNPEEYRRHMGAVLAKYPCVICEDGGRPVAFAYAHQHQSRAAYCFSAELSVYVRNYYSGRGIGAALYTALLDTLKLQNVLTAYGAVSTPNEASERLHERLGFSKAGVWHNTGFKLGEWRDVTWYEKPLGKYVDTPEKFVPINELSASDLAEIMRKVNDMLR